MCRTLAARLIEIAVTLALMSLVVYLLIGLMPGDPINMMIAGDPNVPCTDPMVARFRMTGPDGKLYCALPRFRETLPNGRSYDTIDLGYMPDRDDYHAITIPPDHIFVMGDNRDQSADSRVPSYENGLDGPVPFENIGGRAEFITFSLNGTSKLWNPISWITALRPGRAGLSLHPAVAR